MLCNDLALYLVHIVSFNFNTSPRKMAHQTYRSEINPLKLKFYSYYTLISGRQKGHKDSALDLGILAVPRE